jgi:putative oxidoreductase
MSTTSRQTDPALLVLRLGLAAVFIAHGYMKLFVMKPAGVAGFFGSLGIPLPGLAAWCVTLLEFGGGIALAAGLFTRPIAALFALDMLGAIGFALLPKGFMGGYELELLLAVGSLAVALAGAGAYSVDAQLGAKKA